MGQNVSKRVLVDYTLMYIDIPVGVNAVKHHTGAEAVQS